LSWLPLVVLGAIVALDATSLGQLMLSRPIIAGTLAGALTGLPFEGALVGALLEALSLGIMPVGASKYPETGTAAVAAVGTLGLSGVAPTPAAMLLTLVYGLIWQHLSGATVVAGRHLNERVVRAGRLAVAGRLDRLIEHRHAASVGLDLLRGMAVTAAALAAGVPLLRLGLPLWMLSPMIAALAVSIAAAGVLAGTARLFAQQRRGGVLLAIGLLCGSALLLLLP
jgi:mannose/fructose/N-acetylgalactosamine-specific phosphotransferase system component IIC